MMSVVPDNQRLEKGIMEALGCDDAPITIVDRRANRFTSTFPTEIVTCLLKNGQELRLFCKYSDPAVNHATIHRRGVSFEASVYRHVLAPLNLSSPRLYGHYEDAESNQTWLILECIDENARLNKATDPKTRLIETVRWIAGFHLANESRVSTLGHLLPTYDDAYYAHWARRTSEYAEGLSSEVPWLSGVCSRFELFARQLAASPSTVIHGELYPHNVLIAGPRIAPVDWEAAAIAFGEIDLASLIEAWDTDVVTTAERTYREIRWPGSLPSEGFESRLTAARLYFHFRWLGHRRDWTILGRRWRFQAIRLEAERLGLL